MIFKIAAFIVLSTLFSCQSNLTFKKMSKLDKGMTREEVMSIVGIRPEKEFRFQSKGKSYDVTITPWKPGSTSALALLQTTAYLKTQFYVLYLNGKVRYWGMLNDFSKSEDSEINDLANEIHAKTEQL